MTRDQPLLPPAYDSFLHVGVTGSRDGADERQRAALRYLVSMLPVDRICLHHGSCQGFDKQAYEYFSGLRVPMIVSHPPTATKLRADCPPRNRYDIVLEPKEYKIRDIEIAVASKVLFAAPALPEKEAPRSGTWYTVRRGRGRGIPVFVLPRGES